MTEPLEPLAPDRLARLRAGLRLMALHHLADADAADEVAQEAVARVVTAVNEGRLEDPARLGAFARAIASHVIVDTIRARTRYESLPDANRELVAPATDPLARLVSTEESERVRAALRALSARDRELLRLSYFEGMTPSDLAEHSGEPVDRIRQRKHRALLRLRQAMLGPPGHGGASPPTPEIGPGALRAPAEGTE